MFKKDEMFISYFSCTVSRNYPIVGLPRLARSQHVTGNLSPFFLFGYFKPQSPEGIFIMVRINGNHESTLFKISQLDLKNLKKGQELGFPSNSYLYSTLYIKAVNLEPKFLGKD
jgi:hypothetical protein